MGWLLLQPTPPLWLVLGGALMARLLLVRAHELDYDEGVYWMSLRSLAAGHRLFGEVYSSQPPAFLLLLEPLYRAWPGLLGARLQVVAFSILLVAVAWFAGGRAFGPAGAAMAALVAGFDPLLLRTSITLQADVPAVALAGLAFVLLAQACGERSRPWLAGAAGALAALAVGTKLLALPVGAGFAVLLLERRSWRLWLGAAGGFIVGVAAQLAPVAGDLPAAYEQVIGFHLTGRAVPFGNLWEAWPSPVALELALTVAAAGLALRFRGRAPVRAVAAWAVTAAVFLAVQHPVYPHHAVALLAPVSILVGGLGPPLARLAGPLAARLAGAAIGLAAVLVVIAYFPSAPAVGPAAVHRVLAAGAVVVTDDQFLAAAAGDDAPPELVDTSLLRIASGDLTEAALERAIQSGRVDAVLLGTGRMATMSGFRAWLDDHYGPPVDIGAGRVIYLVPGGPRTR